MVLKLKAMRLCAEQEEEELTARSQKDTVNLKVDLAAPVNISNKLGFSNQEQSDLKAQELDYQIQAIELNKIHEESIETSSIQSSVEDIKKGAKIPGSARSHSLTSD